MMTYNNSSTVRYFFGCKIIYFLGEQFFGLKDILPLRTVYSAIDNAPSGVIKEIILVDKVPGCLKRTDLVSN